MPVLTLGESEYAGPIPDGEIFEAQCVSVRQITEKFLDRNTGEPVQKIEFKFTLQEGEWEGRDVWGKTSLIFNSHAECKLKNWAEGILATELPVGFNLDTDTLTGNFCRVVIGAREYEKDGEMKTANFVRDVMRSRSASSVDSTDF